MHQKQALASLSLFLSIAVLAPAADVTVSSWTPIFQGIDAASGALNGPDASIAQAVRVDLTSPAIRFTTTPASGPLQTTSETTSQFLVNSGVSVAINANFFAPCCNAVAEPKTIIGLAVSDGTLVSPPSSSPGNSNVGLLLTSGNRASIQTTPANLNLADVYNAVAGSAIIVQNGQNVGPSSPAEGDPTHPNPRTDVGISEDGRYLYLVVIDGRQPGYSVGTTIPETADIMIGFGAYIAMNLDGGGSTSLVESDGHGGAIDINRPSGGTERFDANHLGVFAAPIATPEPVTVGLIGLALVMFGVSRFRLFDLRAGR